MDMIPPQMDRCNPLVSQEGDGLLHLTVSLSALRGVSGMWSIPSMRPSSFGQARSGIMHAAIAWDHKPLLLLATALLPNRTTDSFEREAGPPYDKQRIQMALRSGNTVLICFRSGVGHFQSVLIALAADLHTNKPWQGQHKFWKYVSPICTYFAWLPERLARTCCSAALDKCPDLPYSEVHHLQGSDADVKHSRSWFCVVDQACHAAVSISTQCLFHVITRPMRLVGEKPLFTLSGRTPGSLRVAIAGRGRPTCSGHHTSSSGDATLRKQSAPNM